jgi:hypothetical protein
VSAGLVSLVATACGGGSTLLPSIAALDGSAVDGTVVQPDGSHSTDADLYGDATASDAGAGVSDGGPVDDAGNCGAAAVLEMGRDARIATIKANLVKLAMSTFMPLTGNGLRHDTERARVMLAVGVNASQAESLLTYTFGQIQPDGSIPGNTDNNTIVFAMAQVGPILLRYKSQLSAAFLQSAPMAIAKGVAGLHAYPVGPDYTNIYLLKATALLLLGEGLGDATLEQEGIDAFNTWLAYTKTAGIQEYDSPDYTGVQMMALQSAYANTTSQSEKALLGKILDYFWYDIAGNYFATRSSLSGPHSRTYDVLLPTGVQPFYYAEGLGGDATRAGTLDPGAYGAPFLEGTYQPPACALSMSQSSTRTVSSQFGPGTGTGRFNHPGMDRTNYVTSDFAIGSTGSFAGTGQERLLGAEFSTKKNLTVVGVNFADNPFIRGVAGFTVNPKTGAYFTSVQDHGDVLAMYDLMGQANLGNVLVPLGVDATYIDANMVTAAGQALTTQSVVALREGSAVIAIRVLAYNGMPPTLQMGMMGAGRIAIPSQRAVFLVRAAHVDDTTFPGFVSDTAAATATVTGLTGAGPWQAAATIGPLTLEAALGPEPTGRKVNGVPFAPASILSVNGVDYSGVLP